jgi:hypothetical protein
VTCEDRQVLLDLGNTLSDKSSIGRMRGAYVLKLFSLTNCADCMEKEADLALMYLFPWALLEEVIQSRDLSRLDRLEKVLLSFHIFLHSFDLSFLPRVDGVTQRFDKRRTVTVTFAEDSVWPPI